MANSRYLFSSESVTEGHPDKVCDYIADSILDTCLTQDPKSRVACEVLCKDGLVVLAGEVTTSAKVDFDAVARQAIREIGYTDAKEAFNAAGVEVQVRISRQSQEIKQGVDQSEQEAQGAGDQGIMLGYATAETPELMPLPLLLAHKLSRGLAADRKSGAQPWLRPDGKTQVTVEYVDGCPTKVTHVVVSTQHAGEATREQIQDYVKNVLVPREIGSWFNTDIVYHINPTGSFVLGGPSADCGVTGRKIIVDTYGGMARHGGGAFSGKDPSKVDRSAAYFCRHVAREIVKKGLAQRAEIQVAYAIGVAQPISLHIETFGTGDAAAAEEFARSFDWRPSAIIRQLGLLSPIYRKTTNYGHFGTKPELPWEK